MSTLLVRILTD